jgi:predicted GNAT family N-acyltransferase
MGWAKEYMLTHAPGQYIRKVFQATILYLEDKGDFMSTVKHFTFGTDSPVPKDLQTKLLKTAFTAISFGARVSSTGWKNDSGQWTNPAIVDILKNSEDRNRFLADGRIGRLAVLAERRATGVGKRVLQALIDRAHVQGMTRLHLHVRVDAQPFYEKFGFSARGPVFDEAGSPHIEMVRERVSSMGGSGG